MKLDQKEPTGAFLSRPSICVATAEPGGMYHLSFMSTLPDDRLSKYTHLVPVGETLYGRETVQTTTDFEVLKNAERVVIAGGGWSEWTLKITNLAKQLKKPVYYSELSHLPSGEWGKDIKVDGLSALSPDGAASLAGAFKTPVEHILITGNPLFEGLRGETEDDLAVFLSRPELEREDPEKVFERSARALQNLGWRVVIRCHPRENLSTWEGFETSQGGEVINLLSRAGLVFGYPGSAHVLAGVLVGKVICIDPYLKHVVNFSPAWVETFTPICRTVDEVIRQVDTGGAVDLEKLEHLAGPRTGGVERITRFWENLSLQ